MVSFIIRTFNEEKSISHAIDRIHRQEGNYDKEIIIVDSGSLDKTVKIAEDKGCKIVMMRKEDFTWGKSLNLGIAEAKYDYIINISAHCFIKEKDFIDKAISFIKEHELVAAYGRQIGLPYVDPLEEIELAEWFPKQKKYIMNPTTIKKQPLVGISNACCILKKSIWEENKFDETVQSLEDFLWAVNIVKNGYAIGYSDSFAVYHSHEYNADNIYKRWYARTFESLKYQETYNNYSFWKGLIKKHFYQEYLSFTRKKRTEKKYKLLKAEYKKIIGFDLLYSYQQIIDVASREATKVYYKKSTINYKDINRTTELDSIINKLKVLDTSLIKIEEAILSILKY